MAIMASHEGKPGRVPIAWQGCGCPQLRPGCAGWYQAQGCCVAAYGAGWVLLGREATAASLRRHNGDCPRFAYRASEALGAAVAAPTRRLPRPPSWLSSGGRSV
jgi:hypothetical protein